MRRNQEKVVAYGMGIAVGVMAVCFVLNADRVRAAEDPKDVEIKKLQALLEQTKKELDAARKRSDEFADKAIKLTIEAEAAKKETLTAQNEAKVAKSIADEYAKKLEAALAQLAELNRGKVPAVPPALPAGFRALVMDVAGDLVTINVGIDSGLAVGSELDLYRIDNKKDARYLGKLKVTSALNLFPKSAIATFIPARDVPFARLRPEELPKKGDEATAPKDKK